MKATIFFLSVVIVACADNMPKERDSDASIGTDAAVPEPDSGFAGSDSSVSRDGAIAADAHVTDDAGASRDSGISGCRYDFENADFESETGWELSAPATISTGVETEARIQGRGQIAQTICGRNHARMNIGARKYAGMYPYGAVLLADYGGVQQFIDFPWGLNSGRGSVCLGEAMLGGPTRVAFGIPENHLGMPASADYEIGVDYIRVEEDSSCPAPLEVQGGNFEETREGWRVNSAARIDSYRGGSGLFLSLEAGTCAVPVGLTSLSVPIEGRYRVQFHAETLTAGSSSLQVLLDFSSENGRAFSHLSVQDSVTTYSVCVPPGASGLVGELHFQLNPDGNTPSPSRCDSQVLREMWIDDIVLVEDATCSGVSK